jgi:hypothetical protein
LKRPQVRKVIAQTTPARRFGFGLRLALSLQPVLLLSRRASRCGFVGLGGRQTAARPAPAENFGNFVQTLVLLD